MRIKPLAKTVLITLGLTAATVSGKDEEATQKKIYGSSKITLIISNEEMNDIMKIIKSLEDTGLLIESFSEKIKNEAKEQKGGFLGRLLGTVGANLLGNLL